MGKDPRVSFGRRVRALRKERGFSQEGFALHSGLDRSYLGAVERGERNIALINICKIADALGVNPSELMDFLGGKEELAKDP